MSRPPAMPRAGDYAVICHGYVEHPEYWWVAKVEWADHRAALVRWAALGQPVEGALLAEADAIIGVGGEDTCLNIVLAAINVKARHVVEIATAERTLAKAKARAAAAIWAEIADIAARGLAAE